MNEKEIKRAENIRNSYQERKQTKLDELMELDRKVKRPAEIFAYVFGSIGSLVLGSGMSLAMQVLPGGMALGLAIGIVGIGMMSVNYFIYKEILKKRKKKYADRILTLSNRLLNA